jgi:HEAT repeat protein
MVAMDEKPIEQPSATAEPAQAPEKRSPIRSLILVTGSIVAAAWAYNTIREEMKPNSDLIKLLKSSEESERLDAVRRFANVEPENFKTAVPLLLLVANDPSDPVRVARVWTLNAAIRSGLKSDPSLAREATLGLSEALDDKSAEVRGAAADAFGQVVAESKPETLPVEPSALVPKLVSLLADPSENVRKSARRTLGAVASLTSIEPPSALIDGLASGKSVESRAMAAAALGSFKAGTERAVKALTGALKDSEPSVRSNAAGALRNFGVGAASAIPGLVALLDDPFVPSPPSAGPAPVAKAIKKAGGGGTNGELASTDPAVEAARSLGMLFQAQGAKEVKVPDEVLAGLSKILKSDRTNLRNAARDAFRRIGKGAVAVVPSLIEELGRSIPESAPGFGPIVATTLSEVAPGTPKAPEAIASLVGSLEAKSAETRSSVVVALGRFGKAAEATIPRLKEFSEANPDLSASIKTTIDRLEGKAPPEAPRRKGAGGARKKAG